MRPAPIGTTGRRAWFLPGKFRFCPACKHQPPVQAREINKLASLSAEGRSSATTLLVSSALRWMNTHRRLAADRRKLLGFTDNRQDAALQAGHFNDFLFVALLRAAMLAAVRAAGPEGLSEDEFGRRLQGQLGFTASNRERRQEWMLDPEVKGVGSGRGRAHAVARACAPRLGRPAARLALHQSQSGGAGLRPGEYLSLDDLAADDDAFANAPPELRSGSSRDAHAKRCSSPARSSAAWPGSHDGRPRPGERRGDRKCIAAELARPLGDLAAGGAARRGRADHRCPATRGGGLSAASS